MGEGQPGQMEREAVDRCQVFSYRTCCFPSRGLTLCLADTTFIHLFRRHQPGSLVDVSRPVNVLVGGRVTWGLDVSAQEGGPTLASIELDADADVGVSTNVGGTKEVIVTTNARGPVLTIAKLLTIDLRGLADLGQNVLWRFRSASDFLFQYVMYASGTNDISSVLRTAPGLGSLLSPIISFKGTGSLAVQVDAVGAAVRIEIDGSFTIAGDITRQFGLPALGARAAVLLTKKHTESDFRVTLVINGQSYCVGVYSRGVGVPITTCPPGTVKDPSGQLCYPACNAGFSMVGPVCWQTSCPANFVPTAIDCIKPAPYGRGAGFPWQIGDPLFNYDNALRRCRAANPGVDCEMDGLICYVSGTAVAGWRCRWLLLLGSLYGIRYVRALQYLALPILPCDIHALCALLTLASPSFPRCSPLSTAQVPCWLCEVWLLHVHASVPSAHARHGRELPEAELPQRCGRPPGLRGRAAAVGRPVLPGVQGWLCGRGPAVLAVHVPGVMMLSSCVVHNVAAATSFIVLVRHVPPAHPSTIPTFSVPSVSVICVVSNEHCRMRLFRIIHPCPPLTHPARRSLLLYTRAYVCVTVSWVCVHNAWSCPNLIWCN